MLSAVVRRETHPRPPPFRYSGHAGTQPVQQPAAACQGAIDQPENCGVNTLTHTVNDFADTFTDAAQASVISKKANHHGHDHAQAGFYSLGRRVNYALSDLNDGIENSNKN